MKVSLELALKVFDIGKLHWSRDESIYYEEAILLTLR